MQSNAQPPEPDIFVPKTSYCLPTSGAISINFEDRGTGATQWDWNFGSINSNSIDRNPIWVFDQPGVYRVVLTATNAFGSVSTFKDIFIYPSPIVKIRASTQSGCVPLPVLFIDETVPSRIVNGNQTFIDQIKKRTWAIEGGASLPDNTTSISYAFLQPGNPTIQLKVETDVGCIVQFQSPPNFLQVYPSIKAFFELPTPKVCKFPLNITPTNRSDNSSTYTWTVTGTSPVAISDPNAFEPQISFSRPGTYTVILRVGNSNGCSADYSFPYTVPPAEGESSFRIPPVTCLGSVITFTNLSQPAASSNRWFINDREIIPSTKDLVQTFTSIGDFGIRLEAQVGSCLLITTQTVTINPLPVADFSADKQSNCTAPFDVLFTDRSSGNIIKRIWNFGDGPPFSEDAPLLPNVPHRYLSEGKFDVSLVVTNIFGCEKSDYRIGYISISPPKINKVNLPDSGCAPLAIRPKVELENSGGFTYSWTITNSSGNILFSSNLSDPPTYTLAVGKYKVNLSVTSNDGCSNTFPPWDVKVGAPPPDPDFFVSPRDACASEFFSFQYTGGSGATGYKWKFGSNDSSLERDVSKQFKKLGKYDVSLTVYNDGCSKTRKELDFINVKGVVASFDPLLDCSKPLERLMNDQSSGNIEKWEWDFGDNQTSVYTTPQSNLLHTYVKSDNYTITLKVSGEGCSFIDTVQIKVANENTLKFQSLSNPICISDTFFTLKADVNDVGMIKSFNWDYGCGFTGSTQDSEVKIEIAKLCKYPTNNQRGPYTMRLRIVDVNNCIYEDRQDFFVGGSIADYKPLSDISGCSNLPVRFEDLTIGDGTYDIVSRTWNFGDGTPDQELFGPVEHIFSKVGSFEVRLTTRDQLGCISTVQKTTVKTSSPVVDFTAKQRLSCENKDVDFEASPGFISYLWDFDESDLVGPEFRSSNTFTKYLALGSKTVTLRAIDNLGCETFVRKKDYVTIDKPIALFTVNKRVADCPPFKAEFQFTGSYAESFRWNFGNQSTSSLQDPSNLYTLPGTYTVTLDVISPGGCIASAIPLTITVNGASGIARVKPVACEPFIAEFNILSSDAVQVRISYGNGLESPLMPYSTSYTYKYLTPNIYSPKIFLINDKGCETFVPDVGTVKVVDLKPNFRTEPGSLCDQGSVTFTDLTLSNDAVNDWVWDFGDGQTGTGNIATHFYDRPGKYSVTLTPTTQLGCTELSAPKVIEVFARTEMSIAQSKLLVCEEDKVQFEAKQINSTSTPVKKYFWDFANGNSDTLKFPTLQQFRKAGIYPVRLYAANDKGCWDTVLLDLNVNALPKLDAGDDTYLCLGNAIQLNPTGANDYEWFGSSLLSCSNCTQPFITPDQDAIYFVRGTSAAGCSVIDSIKVKVIQPQTLIAPLDTFVCFGGSVKLKASGTDSYLWSPSMGLSETKIADPIAKPDQTTLYTVTGKDAFNCFSSSRKVNVRVIPNPKVDAGSDTTVKAGYPLRLEPTYSADVTKIQWVPSQFLNCTDCRNPVATLSFSSTYTVFVYTKEGCMSKDVINVFATCTKENIFIPNTFSPNGDGYNEIFYPRSRGVERIKSMKIFSRWGQLVYVKENFLANDQLSGWDGKRLGTYVTPDVYVYMIDLLCENGNIITIKGDITLIR